MIQLFRLPHSTDIVYGMLIVKLLETLAAYSTILDSLQGGKNYQALISIRNNIYVIHMEYYGTCFEQCFDR